MMPDTEPTAIALSDIERLVESTERVVERAIDALRAGTDGGRRIDDYQVQGERVAYAATEVAAARDLLRYAQSLREAGRPDETTGRMAAVFAGEVALAVAGRVEEHLDAFGVPADLLAATLHAPEIKSLACAAVRDDRVCAIGRWVLERRGVNDGWIGDEIAVMARESVRQFADAEVAPMAERIHRNDELVPDALIAKMAQLGYFGMAVPEEYGGQGMSNLVMILTTEELSRASLAAAGSLITRPEILTKALLQGGTEAQKSRWLPRIASGDVMVGISVTEPDIGSDVASVKCKAEPVEVEGKKGYAVSGAKAWCTFAGRANVLALLARTDPDASKRARGLSLLIVEKDVFPGREFVMRQPTGGVIEGKADATPGYRGMHSFTLNFDNYFVPAENLVGEENGMGKGFYLQMEGFAAGRLQTGGRATGLAQAALERTAEYANDRYQFGRPIGEYQLTQHKLGRMATHIAAARGLTYAAALAMDEGESAALRAAMAKLFASDVAVWTTQEGQLLHGGWGYAEEFAISRYVSDALVLPIFEGVKPILELKVIARALLGRAA